MRRLLPPLAGLILASCSSVLSYTEELVDEDTGRTLLVRGPANLGGTVGFVAGLPVSLAAVPVTGTIFLLRPEDEPVDGTLLLFPSFVLWKVGALLATPFDVLEFALWRGWQETPPLSEEQRRRLEARLDRETRPQHPATPVFPPPPDDR